MTILTPDTLNRTADFDHVFGVGADGRLWEITDLYAPTVTHSDTTDVDIDDSEWSAWSTGRSGQYGYRGPTMHASETLSGGMARDLLSEPGVYVVTTVEVLDCEDCENSDDRDEADCGGDHFPAGWIVLRHDENACQCPDYDPWAETRATMVHYADACPLREV